MRSTWQICENRRGKIVAGAGKGVLKRGSDRNASFSSALCKIFLKKFLEWPAQKDDLLNKKLLFDEQTVFPALFVIRNSP